MTDLNTLNLQQIITNTFQELLTKNSLTISPKKTNFLLWTNKNPNLPNTFILKDNEGNRLLGLTRTDRNGETYWKFRNLEEEKLSDNNQSNNPPAEINQSENPQSSPAMDNIQKFQQRQAKTEQLNTYGKPSSNQTEQSVNNS